MSQNELPADDPRLTAYALGELDPTEQESLEQLLFDSPQAQAAVREIRELAGLLTTELRQEPVVGLTAQQRTAILVAGGPAAEAAHEPAHASSNHRGSTHWVSKLWVKRFASLATIAALVVVVAVLTSPTRPQTDLPKLAQNWRVLGESESLGLPYEYGLHEGVDSLRDTTTLALRPHPSHLVAEPAIDDGSADAVMFDDIAGVPLGVPSDVTGGGTENASRSPVAAGFEPAQKVAKKEQQVAAGFKYPRPAEGRGLAASANKPGMPQSRNDQSGKDQSGTDEAGKPTTTFYLAPELKGVSERSGRAARIPATKKVAAVDKLRGYQRSADMPADGEARTAPVTASSVQMGRTEKAGIPAANRTVAVDQLRTDVRNLAFRAEGLAQTDPAAARALIENAETAVKNSQGIDGKVTGQLLKSLAKSRDSIDWGRQAGESELARRKSEVEDTIKREERTGVRIDPQFAQKVETYNKLLKEKRFDEAIVVGKEAQTLQPENPISELMELKARLAKQVNTSPQDGYLLEERETRGVRKERLAEEVARTIEITNKVGSQDPVAAVGALKRTLTTLESSNDFDPEVRERLRTKVQASLAQLLAGRDKVELDRIAALERSSAVRAREFGEQRDEFGLELGLQESILYRRNLRRGEAPGAEVYEPIIENLFFSAYEDPLSTFGVDVDTASYANVRRFLTDRQLPPPNAVRIEEFVNYFSYDYPQPAAGQPFSVNVEAANCPWNPGHQLVRIGLKGREIPLDQRPASNLVFLVDVSGSMQAENKLPLVKMGLNLLTQQMTESDRVAIVTYSDSAVQRLESTNGTNKQQITQVIDSLQAAGSTNGAAGIQLAYRAALEHFIDGGANRVILCTDGDFNVGVKDDDELVQLIQERARTKVFFSVLGFGMGNLKDGKLEKLADKGNGQYAYIDGQREAHKMFVDELVGTLVTIAKDVKLQVEFNPNQVGAYRLIGYENRVMAAQDFNNDKKDAGEVGAGHTVTALYEIIPAGEAPKPELGDALRYRKAVVPQEGEVARELLTVKLRYKLPEADVSTLLEFPAAAAGIRKAGLADKPDGVSSAASPDFNWAAAVAAYGMILRNSQFRGQASFDMVLELAQGAKGEDKSGQRAEFIELVKTAKALCLPATPPAPTPEPPATLTREQAEAKASVNGKYTNLLRIVPAPGDAVTTGSFHDYGRWEGTSYAGQNNLPQGYWVYVAPNWYIWGDAK